MKQHDHATLRTICGAVKYDMFTYNNLEPSGRDWEILLWHTHIPKDAVYCIEVLTKNGFILKTKDITLKYVHNDNHDLRIVEISENNSA